MTVLKKKIWGSIRKTDKHKVRAGHTQPNNRAAVKVKKAECNCCGIRLFVHIRTIVLSCVTQVQRNLLWLKVVLFDVSGMEYGH